ncbi:hypothetical protein SAMN05660199_04476 [Klenkia soli]|uniref:Pyridoxamine 5'-phosphate oxidase N-terminal domain-containing protein n=1 Tax=Klenkia soli TaxID=1052260 RepID=A0A1H0UEG9_9ACTN|nr:MSMEG_1061 family FMN-dependent PPOX-type flavoprotein [Klenkia soli]SDP64415.1 hypothetical protein SAMN05660199_04476 [Klenkia soli]
MTSWDDLPTVRTAAELEAFGVPAPAVRDKSRDVLHPRHVEWIARTPLVVLATTGADGRCDASPKGDPPGFVQVLDEHTLAIPERAGNKRFDGFHNVLAVPQVGLLFVVPGRTDTLRVNGRAQLVTDGPFFPDLEEQGHRPVLALLVHVEEVYFHCAKAFLRSRTWEPGTWHPELLPRHAVTAKELVRPDTPLAELDAYYGEQYRAGLYPTT